MTKPDKMKRYKIADIKRNAEVAGSFFFSRDTMAFFGDTMNNLGVLNTPRGPIVYRKRGRFAAWQFDPETWRNHPLDYKSLDDLREDYPRGRNVRQETGGAVLREIDDKSRELVAKVVE